MLDKSVKMLYTYIAYKTKKKIQIFAENTGGIYRREIFSGLFTVYF